MDDDEPSAPAHGGYSVFSRFLTRFTVVHAPTGAVAPTIEEVCAHHPYLRRIRARGATVRMAWVVEIQRGGGSLDESARLAYWFLNEWRDDEEAVVMNDPEQLVRWIAAMKRGGYRNR
jgi:hypothetical protein